MNVALTGGTGFVGSHLAEALRARGDAVTCLVRTSAAAAPLQALGCRCVVGTLEDDRALATLVNGAEIVYHVAGLVGLASAEALLRVNRDGAARVADAARAAGVRRLLHVSSLAVTGPTVPGRALDEAGAPRPVTTYGRSKQAGEDAVRASGATFTIVRPPIVYGPRDRQVLRLFRMARRGLAPLLGDGRRQELSLVHARDLAGALVAAATSEHTAGGTYHAAHPIPVTQRALVEGIGAALGRRVRLVALSPTLVRSALAVAGAAARLRGRATLLDPAKAAELLAPAWTCSSAALERDAGWRAATSLQDGLGETAHWYRQAGWL
jgi:nucleoside-diphosphate-sugar epimerase